MLKSSTPSFQKHFLGGMELYMHAIIEESKHRDLAKTYSIEGYMVLRRGNTAVPAILALLELGLNLPDEVMEHPYVKAMTLAANEMVGIGNDLLSYNKEQADGTDDHNFVSVTMREANVGAQEAIYRTCSYHMAQEAAYNDAYAKFYSAMPLWDAKFNAEAIEYIEGIGNCVRSNFQWCFESNRYFGSQSKEVQQTGMFKLLPKKTAV